MAIATTTATKAIQEMATTEAARMAMTAGSATTPDIRTAFPWRGMTPTGTNRSTRIRVDASTTGTTATAASTETRARTETSTRMATAPDTRRRTTEGIEGRAGRWWLVADCWSRALGAPYKLRLGGTAE